MTFAVLFFILILIIEFGYFHLDLRENKQVNIGLMALVAISGLFLLFKSPNIIILVIVGASFYRALNILRIIKPRMYRAYLDRATSRTSLWLSVFQTIVLAMYLIFNSRKEFGLMMHFILYGVLYLQLALAAIVLVSTFVNRRTSSLVSKVNEDQDFPTVTVCIPARNESDDLRDCLDLLLASDYPKLEIIVLDDCSTSKHTPDIIKSYAQSGVIFIAGTPPPSYWLAKNWAYDQLVKVANGDVMIFCGVDARFNSSTISNVISQMRRKNLDMISIIPTLLNLKSNPFVQTMRYWWELSMPRTLMSRPSVISTFWAIDSSSLHKLGGFNSTRRMITPEAYFAKQLSSEKKYHFYRDCRVFGLSTDKTSAEQYSTAIRVRYPQLHKRPEIVYLFTLLMFIGAVFPFAGALVLWITSPISAISSLVVSMFYVASYYMIIRSVRTEGSLSVSLMFPFAVMVDLFLLHLSMYRYEFSSVEWKGRNICIPVMHMTSSHVGRRPVH